MNKIKCHLCAALTVVLLFSALGCSAPDSGNAGKSDAATQNLDSVGGRETVGYILPDIADGYWEIFDALAIYKLYQQIALENLWIISVSKHSVLMFAVCSMGLTIVFSLFFAYQATRVEIVKYLKAE